MTEPSDESIQRVFLFCYLLQLRVPALTKPSKCRGLHIMPWDWRQFLVWILTVSLGTGDEIIESLPFAIATDDRSQHVINFSSLCSGVIRTLFIREHFFISFSLPLWVLVTRTTVVLLSCFDTRTAKDCDGTSDPLTRTPHQLWRVLKCWYYLV
jgi:hypothetical protein